MNHNSVNILMAETFQLWLAPGSSNDVSTHKKIADKMSFATAATNCINMKHDFDLKFIMAGLAGKNVRDDRIYIRDAFEPTYKVCIGEDSRIFYSSAEANIWRQKLVDAAQIHKSLRSKKINIVEIDHCGERGENMPQLIDSDDNAPQLLDSDDNAPQLLDGDNDVPQLINDDDSDNDDDANNNDNDNDDDSDDDDNVFTILMNLFQARERLRRNLQEYLPDHPDVPNLPDIQQFMNENTRARQVAVAVCNDCNGNVQHLTSDEMLTFAESLPEDYVPNKCAFCNCDL